MLTQAPNTSPHWASHRRRRLLALVTTAALALAGGEGVARYGMGLGDPPLNDAYPDLEYAFRPGTYRRFGNVMHINSHHMRSPEVPPRKSRADEVRVMLMGDSVINGGTLTDQADLASELLPPRLAAALGHPVVVGNISAGSWGPGNLLAYARRFGLFEADVVVIVVNSEDASDNPTGRPIVGVDPSFPDRRPWSALAEAVARYVVPRLGRMFSTHEPPAIVDSATAEDRLSRGMKDLSELCNLAAASGARVLLVHFPNRDELEGLILPGHEAIVRLAEEKPVRLIELKNPLAASLAAGADPYRPQDSIHPNEVGQKIIAEVLTPAIVDLVAGAP